MRNFQSSERLDRLPLTWRSLSETDVKKLHSLLGKIEEHEQTLSRTTEADIVRTLSRPAGWAAIGAFSEASAGEELVGFGHVGLAEDGTKEAICQGGVCPQWRGQGIGTELLAWETRTAQELLASIFPNATGSITHRVPDTDRAQQKHLERLGYEWRNSYAELRLAIQDIPAKAPLPAKMEIVEWTEDWDDATRRSYNKMLSLAGSAGRVSAEKWAQMHAEVVRPWSFVAYDGWGDRPRVVGMLSVGRYPQDWDALGWKEGFTEVVAVLEPEHRRNVLLALVRSAMKAQKKAGIEKMAVGIDPIANNEMMQLYLDLGFEVSAWSRIYAMSEKPVPSD